MKKIDLVIRAMTYTPYLWHFNATAPRKAKIAYNFGLSECNRINNAFIKIMNFLTDST